MATDRPADYSKWPVGIRKLYDAIVCALATKEADAYESAMKHLNGLMYREEDRTLADVATDAWLELLVKTIPEELAPHYLRDGRQWSIELAREILSSSMDETQRRIAEKALRMAMSAFPPKGRA